MNKKNNYNYIHIIIYLTYSCNLRCSYCVLTFNNYKISFSNLDNIKNFVLSICNNFSEVFIEFIGGEPLLCINEIEYLLSYSLPKNIKYQITTNGIFINSYIYENIIKKINKVNLSYNENYFKNNRSFIKLSKILKDKSNININFIYDPKRTLKEIKDNFSLLLKLGFRNINILPIVLTESYDSNDFSQLLKFFKYTTIFNKRINIGYIYYIQEKKSHLEISIDPHGNVFGDNMGTAEEFFSVSYSFNSFVGKIGDLSMNDILYKLDNYKYEKYLENLTLNGNTKQSYNNLLKLSNLLKEFNNKLNSVN